MNSESGKAGSTPLQVVMIGGGLMGHQHAHAIRRLTDRATLVSVVEPSEERRRRFERAFPGVEGFGTLEDLEASGVHGDVAHIVTPPETHVAVARQALAANLHVYVEKPVAETVREVDDLLHEASARGLRICPGYQLLFQRSTRQAARLLPALGPVVHAESYFSFRPVRRAPGGRVPLRSDLQLLDVLPHPVYLLLWALEQGAAGPLERATVEVGARGDLHAILRRGRATGVLAVTLEGRPVESYLRIVGTRGTLVADYVRGTVRKLLGPGTSAVDKILAPYRESRQLVTGTTGALARRLFGESRSYPGLQELIEAFYGSILGATPPPVSADALRDTVAVCAYASEALRNLEREWLRRVDRPSAAGRRVLVTGGTGFLGQALVQALVRRGMAVRVVSRRLPPAWEQVPGTQYVSGDLGVQVPDGLLDGVEVVIHAAAETAGGWEAHQTNSIGATGRILRATAAAGVPRFLHVSSLAVLRGGRAPIREETPLESDRRLGPYVWGKVESERLAVSLGREMGVSVKIARPGALIDKEELDPPGRLGKRVGNLFVAVGSPRDRLGVVDVRFTADVLAWMADRWEEAPEVINVLDPNLPEKRTLVRILRASNPDLRVIWLPTVLLGPLSGVALLLQRILRRGQPAISLARVFARQVYDTSRITAVSGQARLGSD